MPLFLTSLPTTCVTFMVDEGASPADGARGREGAVLRVSGLLMVTGGTLAIPAQVILAACIPFRTFSGRNSRFEKLSKPDQAQQGQPGTIRKP